jgi:tRNA pseudouridine55 synthase
MKTSKINKEINEAGSGFILINKEDGPTSHAIVNRLRKITGIKKIGHAGTLDPFASGLMILGISRQATKQINSFLKLDKKYEAEIFLGKATDTYDRCGKTTKEYSGEKISKEKLLEALKKIEKNRTQTPPMYSAKKVKGKKLYELARKNITIERKKQKIKIFYIKLKKYEWPNAKIEVHCSSGTYIRSIANDLGEKLKCFAHLKELKRVEIGSHKLEDSIETKKLNQDNWKKFLFQKIE